MLDDVLLEYDGREQRLLKAVFAHDRRRQNALVDRGAELRRYVSDDVSPARREWLCAEVRRAVRAAAGRPQPELVRGRDTLRPPRLSPLPTCAASRTHSGDDLRRVGPRHATHRPT